MNDNFLVRLYSRPETVLTINEISQIFRGISYKSVRDRLHYYSKTRKLQRIHQGIYAKPSYNPLELANKIYTPSYISLETVLAREGVVFQYYETIFVVSYLTRTMAVGGTEIQYRQLKGGVLANMLGIEQRVGHAIATLERAFLDAVYIYKDYHFDNLGVIDWQKVDEMKSIYKSDAFEKRITGYHKIYQAEYAQH